MATLTMTHKRGDTFDALAPIPDIFADGYFVGWVVTAQIRTAQYGRLIADLTCTWADDVTTRILHIQDFVTDSWEIGPAEMDIQFTRTSDDYTMSTQTLKVMIVKDITHTGA